MAYSSIGHIGYALAGVATGVISGYQSAIIYISIYVIMNIGAFSCLYLLKKDGQYKENISDLSGISKKHPVLAISLLIILFSLAGSSTTWRIFCKILCFCCCAGDGNVRISNCWIINNGNVCFLLFENYKNYLF